MGMQQQNDAQIAELEAKVSQLKSISDSIGKEVKSSNNLIENMTQGFDKAGTLLKGTLGNLTKSVQHKTGNSGGLVVLFLLLFLALYFLSSRRLRGGGGGAGGI